MLDGWSHVHCANTIHARMIRRRPLPDPLVDSYLFNLQASSDALSLLPRLVDRMASHMENLEKSGSLTSLVREKSGKLWLAYDVLPQLR